MKNYYAPDTDMHEIPIENFVADIYTGQEIIEIQTRAFNKMRRKLDAFLPLYPVTIVYPIPHIKAPQLPYHCPLYSVNPALSTPALRHCP